jgi:hypothetical protein
MLRSTRAKGVVALAAVGIAGFAAIAHAQSAGATTLKTFTTPGTYSWKVPTGVTSVTFDVYGARGGGVNEFIGGVLNVISSGGPGGEARAKFKVHAGEVFEIVVGGQGGSATVGQATGAAGSNGGGHGAAGYGGGGGGGSDVRIGGRGNPCAASMACGYGGRIIVGGGGGGGTNATGGGVGFYDGGVGGGLRGGDHPCDASRGVGGAQDCGGVTDPLDCTPDSAGGFGTGGNACVGLSVGSGNNEDGAGGGGWYGGGSGAAQGGGGSGYISPFSLSGSFPGGTSVGNGKVTITTTT